MSGLRFRVLGYGFRVGIQNFGAYSAIRFRVERV